MPRFIALLAVFMLAALVSGCDSDEDGFSGITHTASDGSIIGPDDEDDWQPRCSDSGGGGISLDPPFCFGPALPNPTSDLAYLEMVFQRDVTATVYVESEPGERVTTLFDEVSLSADIAQAVEWEPDPSLPDGIYRIFLEASSEETDDTYESYGDVRLERSGEDE